MKLSQLFVTLFLIFAEQGLAKDLRITCMEMLQGNPTEPVVYTYAEKTGELRSSKYSEGPLSTLKEIKLSHTTSEDGGAQSYSVHEWVKKGEVLKRTVKYVPDPGSKAKPETYTTLWDFRKQTIIGTDDNLDSCHHELYKK